MSVHYKFKSALDYDTVTFDGLHISVGDLKSAISQQKRIGKTSDFDLEITNAQTKEVYVDDHTLIPKNTSLLVARVPLSQQPKKHWDGGNQSSSTLHKDVAPNKGLADLSRMEGSEQDKINAMISQSTFDYDPSNYQKIRGANQRGVVPPGYTCYKCQKRGHWIKDCPLANSSDPVEIRRSTGIPRSFMVPVEGPKAPGAMMTPTGSFAVPVVDREAYLASENAGGGDTPSNAPAAPDTTVPDELVCSLCRDLLTDAVMIPCCGNSFCDECIRGALLESEDHECPDCREKEIAPTTLIPNRFLRNSVSSFRNQTGYSRRMPHRAQANPLEMPLILPARPAVPVVEPANGPAQPAPDANARRSSVCEDSDGSGDDNITVKVPPARVHAAGAPRASRPPARGLHRTARYGPPPVLKPPGIDGPAIAPVNMPPRIDEQRASTPTVDERRDPMAQPVFNRGAPSSQFMPGGPIRPRHFDGPPFGRKGPPGMHEPAPYGGRFPREPYQPPPPGIKDSPNGRSDDPLEAFNRMIREKEMRAKRREERRRNASGSRSPRSRGSRSPRSPRSPPPRLVRASRSPRLVRDSRSPRPPRSPRSPRLPRSPRASRSPRPLRASISPRAPRSPRSPRPLRASRSPRPPRSPRGPRSPRARPRSRGSSRLRYSRSRSPSRGRMRRSPPWSPRRRRTRERTLSLTRSPSPRRRHRSPLRYRSPLRSPPRTPLRSPHRSPHRSPPRSPHRLGRASPPRSPHRYPGVYDELLSPPRRNVEPPYGARYGPRNNLPPPNYPPMGVKPMPQLMNIPIQPDQAPLGYRGRYEGPPFDDIPPGVEPPVPGFEPPPFEKPPFGPPIAIERDRMQPAPFRDPYGPRPMPYEGPGGFREMPLPIPTEIQVHVGDARFRDNFRPGPPFRDQGSVPFRDGQPFRDVAPQGPYRDPNFRGGIPPFRDGQFRNVAFREGGFRENPPHGTFREGPPFRPPTLEVRDPREPIPPNFHDPNYRNNYRDEGGVPREHVRPSSRTNSRRPGPPRRHPNAEHERNRERDGHDKERYIENRDPTDRVERGRDAERIRDPERKGREGRSRDERRDYDKERDHERLTPDKKQRGSPKRSRDMRDKRRSESRGRSRERDRESKRDKKEDRVRDKASPDKVKEHKDRDKKLKDRKKKKREKEKDGEKKKKRERKEKKDKDFKKDEEAVKDEENKESEEAPTPVAAASDDILLKNKIEVKNDPNAAEDSATKEEKNLKIESKEKHHDDLYGDESAEAVDKKIMETYVNVEENKHSPVNNLDTSKEEPFDGIELQANTDELDLKIEPEVNNTSIKEVLAPMPVLSKWEVDDDNPEKTREPGELSSPEAEVGSGKVTSDVIKRAENAIFAKAINSLRPIEIKKISSERVKLYGDEPPKSSMNNIHVTVPVTDSDNRSIETNEKKPRYSKTPPPRLSVKERLGGKVDDVRRTREPRVVHSTVELVNSRSKTPKKEQPYRRVTMEKEKARKHDAGGRDEAKSERRVLSESVKTEKPRGRSQEKTELDKKADKKKNDHSESRDRTRDKKASGDGKSRERKKSTLDEASFEPDYDETIESDIDHKHESAKKRERSSSPPGNELKKPKIEPETIKLDLANVKKKPDSESESSSGSGDSSSSSSSDGRKKKKKKKRSRKKKKRAASDSESESDSSLDEHKKKKKKRKHKKKSSKKKAKKSKHK